MWRINIFDPNYLNAIWEYRDFFLLEDDCSTSDTGLDNFKRWETRSRVNDLFTTIIIIFLIIKSSHN